MRLNRLRWAGIAAVLLAIGLTVRWLAPGAPDVDDLGGPVLLVHAGDDSDALQGWTLLLDARFGAHDRLDLRRRRLGAALDVERRVVVLTQAAAARVDPSELDRLQSSVQAGLDVVLEAPDSLAADRAGLRLSTVEDRQRLPWPTDEDIGWWLERRLAPPPALLELPHRSWRYAPWPDRRPVTAARVRVQGRAEVWAREDGAGQWIVLGRPAGRIHAELVRGAITAGYPWAAAWARTFLSDELGSTPWPGLFGARGASDPAPSARARWTWSEPELEISSDRAPLGRVELPVRWRGRFLARWSTQAQGLEVERSNGPGGPTVGVVSRDGTLHALRAVYAAPEEAPW